MFTHIDQVPARRQWEENSKPNQAVNCNPTSVTFVADFYRDATFGIEATRDLVPTTDGQGTSAEQAAEMLRRRGVPCAVQQPTMAQLKAHLNTRPVVIGMDMSKVPAAIRGHTFEGIHGVAGRENAVVNGVTGVLVMDPNFGYGHAVDVTNGSRFYPDSVLTAARSLSGGWRRAIVPAAAKEVGLVPIIENIPQGFPAGTALVFKAGVKYTGWTYDAAGRKVPFSLTPSAATSAQTTALVKWAGEPLPAYYIPRIYANGWKDDAYLTPNSETDPGVQLPAGPNDPGAARKAAHDAAMDVAIQAGVPLVAKYAEEKYPDA